MKAPKWFFEFMNRKKARDYYFTPPQYKDIEIGNLIFGHSRGNYAVDRRMIEEEFKIFLERNCFNTYGFKYDEHQKQLPMYEDNASFKNETFEIRPYYWGDDETIQALPNFVYYPTNFTLSWYKYPLRDAYCSRLLTKEEWIEMLSDCEKSLQQS